MNIPQQAKGGKKKSGNKNHINAFFIVIGDSIKLNYAIEDSDSHSYKFSLTLESGDAFTVTSDVKGFSFGVAEVLNTSKPEDLLLREGTLLLTVERE